MHRRVLIGLWLCLGTAAGASRADDLTKPPRAPEDVAARLKERHDFPEIPADPQTKLGTVLNSLSIKCKVAFTIKTAAFVADGINEPSEIGVVAERPVPRQTGVTLEAYLAHVLERVPAPSGVVVLVRRDALEVTTWAAAKAQIWGPSYKGPFLALVHSHIQKKPLEDALGELADQAEYNIVVDPRVADAARTPVSARFVNVPLDTAAALLAETAGLEIVPRDNTLLVTTKEVAGRLREKQKPDAGRKGKSLGPRVGAGVRSPHPPPVIGGGPPPPAKDGQ